VPYIAEICHTNNHSTCDDNDVANYSEESIEDEKEDSIHSHKAKFNKDVQEEENNVNEYKDLNELLDYINEDDSQGKLKNSPKKKKAVMKTNPNTKKKKKSKKNIYINEQVFQEESIGKEKEEDKSVVEFKMKLENESANAKEKQKIKPFYSSRFLSYLSSHLIKN
jgi:hypothetical protein